MQYKKTAIKIARGLLIASLSLGFAGIEAVKIKEGYVYGKDYYPKRIWQNVTLPEQYIIIVQDCEEKNREMKCKHLHFSVDKKTFGEVKLGEPIKNREKYNKLIKG